MNPARVALALCLLVWLAHAPSRAEEDPPEPNYVYWARLVRVVDGDHVAFDIDLGFGVWVHNQSLALLDAGGSGQDETARARDGERIKKLRELLAEAADIVVKTVRDRDASPPRYLVTVWADGIDVNAEMRKAFP